MNAVVNTLLSDSARSLSEHTERKRMRHEVEPKQQFVEEEWRSDGWGHGWKAAHADFPVKPRTRSLLPRLLLAPFLRCPYCTELGARHALLAG